ncbi:MAG: amidase [Pyrinomonadaceae bacterium]|nr:amidase [Pyrinomonadaceae bacterium]MCX7640280.1 amidase [Pyrinomonadaceae bacterium]MDW8305272.1 amidase [Acidobacteriota bacterium]
MRRREFLVFSALGGAGFFMTEGLRKDFVLEEASIAEMQEAMVSGKINAVELAKRYVERIEQIDQKLLSVVEINPDAFKIAESLDKERRSGRVRSALHGIPILLKDNIDTADRMKTTAGSLALVDAPAPKRDAFIVEKLRQAGAVILGKTNLSEWANFRSEDSSSGWSARGGQTRNPYILDRNPCGSSSGSAVSVSANLCAASIGTETDGSIVCPSSVNGIVGLKPTVGLVSRSGIIPIAHSQDTAGPMTRSVADAAIILTVIAGFDERDRATSQANKMAQDYTKFLKKDGLRGKRIGIARQYFGRNSRVDKLMEEQIQVLKSAGAEVVDINFPGFGKFGEAEFEVLLYEFKHYIERYLQERGGKHRTLADLIKFNEENKEKEMPYFGQDIFLKAEAKGSLEDRAYRLSLLQSKVMTQDRGIDSVVQQYKIDAIMAPSNAPVWLIDLINGDSPTNYISSSSIPAVAGYPNITVPAGFINELPIGVSFFGPAFSEPVLIEIAYAFEQITKARRKPKFLTTYP